MAGKFLVIGACGQIGSELVRTLRNKHGGANVVAADLRTPEGELFDGGPFEALDIMDAKALKDIVTKHHVTEVYLLAALLSATAEKKPDFAWELNMVGLFNVLNLAKEGTIKKVFWPSSIAVFGPTTPKLNTPQTTIMEPTTVYGISKQAGERWCEYYNRVYGVDVRSIRYPGLISYSTPPGGGTTDYAVEIFYEANKSKSYTCFLKENTPLPMMYMEDAIRATIQLMEAPTEKIKIRSSYNLAGVSFTPKEIASEIKKWIPEFKIDYNPDFRQKIAESWPGSIDDSEAKNQWNWNPKYMLGDIVKIMIENTQ
jgi:nucleoside-diphosphate-sugar epimerase